MNEAIAELERIITDNQIYSVFQPIVSLRDCQITGYEALSRIRGNSTIQNTEELFHLAAENNMIWQLEQLCRISTFNALSKKFSTRYEKLLFLNVSPSVINDKSFREGFTHKYIKENNIKASQIIFEITEREAISDMAAFLNTLNHYRRQMYEIAIDDVGSGYSGLGLICDVQPQYVKIDMKIIRNIHMNKLQYAMVKSLVELANAAGIELIAEGIETREEMEALVKLNVHYGQGFYFSKPDTSFENAERNVDFVRPEVHAANQLHNRTGQFGMDSFSIKNITSDGVIIPITMRISRLSEMFEKDHGLVGVTIVNDRHVMGIVTREQLNRKLSGRYGFTLYQNKEVVSIMDNDFLEADYLTSIKDVSDLAMQRKREAIYDFIVITRDDEYYGIVTVKELLCKSMEIAVCIARDTNPLTGLPGNNIIQQRINSYLGHPFSYSIMYIDIDNFKAYNDAYGFANGDLVIKLLADILKDSISNDDFIGHIGGDDFIIILNNYDYDKTFALISTRFSAEALMLYPEKDRRNGYITVANRKGEIEHFPLVSLTAAVASNLTDTTCSTSSELMEMLAKRKKEGKQTVGNSIVA